MESRSWWFGSYVKVFSCPIVALRRKVNAQKYVSILSDQMMALYSKTVMY